MNQEFDYAVIGSGLTGLMIATALSQETDSVVLVEGQDVIGGYHREIKFPTGSTDNGLRFIPATDAAVKAVEFLESLLGLKLIKSIREVPPLTYENSQLKTFLSFGDITPAFFEEIVYFSASTQIELNLLPFQWMQQLAQKYRGQIMTRSFATRFQTEGNQVTNLTINGSKILKAKNYIFCGSVKQLQTLLPMESLSPRARQKISKNSYWTALCLDLCHSHVVNESDSIHILNGTTQDDIGPCAGRFLKPEVVGDKTLQASQWITFVDEEVSEDSEVVAQALKKVKKQIKRAYPDAFNDLLTERILVAAQIAGDGDLKLKGNMTLPEVDNLWIGSPTLNPQKNLVGALLQAQMLLTALGFQTGVDMVAQAPNLEI